MNTFSTVAGIALGAALVRGQGIGTNTAETHPALTWAQCTASGCTNVAGSITLDANWRWTHSTTGYTNCYTGNAWDATLCPDPTTCASNCVLDGASYSSTYGISTSGNALTLNFVTPNSNGKNVGSRTYLMADNTHYQIFKLLNREFTFDVNVSQLGCGLNGALYFSEMAADGGMSAFPTNKAGAQYGTGYCDSQCPRDLKFIDGKANTVGWNGTSANSGKGSIGACCNEMDIWEANSIAAAVTPHPCNEPGLTACTGSSCTSTCDQAGCDFNSYRMGNTTFYGPGSGFTIDTTKLITVVTQFVTTDGTDTGTLAAIYRTYVQGGNVIQNSQSLLAGAPGNYISDSWCAAQKASTGDTNTFATYGGLTEMGQAFGRGMVLVLSIWDDYAVSMLWLDSDYPTTADPTAPGVARGSCATTSGVPADVESSQSSDKVVYSNIKFGALGSTTPGVAAPPAWNGGSPSSQSTGPTTTPVSPPPSSSSSSKSTTTTTPPKSTTTTTSTKSSSAPGATQTHYGQCGGIGWTGPKICASGYTCKASGSYYSQCV